LAESTRNSDKGVSRLNRFSDRSGDNFGCTVPFFRAKFTVDNWYYESDDMLRICGKISSVLFLSVKKERAYPYRKCKTERNIDSKKIL